MIKLIVGLGNPGDRYNFTRHNLGFLVLDFYAKIHGLDWQASPKFGAIWTRHGDTFLIKPQEFYNDTGRAVQAFCHYYKIPSAQILAICDDFSLEFGKIRYREHGSAGGNNGLKSIIAHLGTENFSRLRLGTANDALRQKLGDTDFVLGRFTEAEREQLPTILKTTCDRVDELIS